MGDGCCGAVPRGGVKPLTTTTPLSVPANALLGVLAARSMSAHALQL